MPGVARYTDESIASFLTVGLRPDAEGVASAMPSSNCKTTAYRCKVHIHGIIFEVRIAQSSASLVPATRFVDHRGQWRAGIRTRRSSVHATIQKPIEEVLAHLSPGERVFVVGCGNCTAKCHSGGEPGTEEIAERRG